MGLTASRAVEIETTQLEIERVGGTLGAEVSGIDLGKTLDTATRQALEDALVTHKVLFFRDQAITTEQHLAFGRQFGPLEVHPFFAYGMSNSNDSQHPELIIIKSDEKTQARADMWHSDVTWRECPSLASILRARQVPAAGGDTLWADMAAAYDGLGSHMQSFISGLTAIHDSHGFRRGLKAQGVPAAEIDALETKFPPMEHPVVRTHPVSGRKILYVNKAFTVCIKGMKEAESTHLLDYLYRQASIPDYQVRLRWRKDTIAFWDNRSTQHYAVFDYAPQRRVMERVTVAGDRPF